MSSRQGQEHGRLGLQQWRIGDVRITKLVECQHAFDITVMFPDATREEVLALPWLKPHFLTPDGRCIISFHALVVDTPRKRIIVDTCNGNDKHRPLALDLFSNLRTSFLRDLEAAGFRRDSFDVVLCTHLHSDHIGWNTMLVEGKWVPTFPRARYLLNRTEYDYWRAPYNVPTAHGWAESAKLSFDDSVRPVMDAGLVDLVEGTHKVCEEVSLVPTAGHSPGHVSVRILSRGEEGLITGDLTHHPSQLAHPDWGLSIDFDSAQATKTRRRVFADAAERSILVIGTHWAGVTAGRVVRCGTAFRLDC